METYEKLTIKMAKNLACPPTWVASVIPSFFGVFLSYAFGFNLGIIRSAALIIVCILMQSAVNTLNDYFDYVKGTDQKTDNLEVSDAVLLYNNINPKSALMLGLGFLFAAAVIGIAAVWGRGWLPFALGIAGGLCVVFYSGGKHPISYLPLGEIISGLVMGGFIPVAIVSVACKSAADVRVWATLFLSVPLIIGIALIMMTNNTCDIEKDIAAQRRTFPTSVGREKARITYRVLAAAWFAFIAVLMFRAGMSYKYIFIFFAVLILVSLRKFVFLWKSPITPDNRIAQMKGIIKANVFGNGLYTLMFLMLAFAVRLA